MANNSPSDRQLKQRGVGSRFRCICVSKISFQDGDFPQPVRILLNLFHSRQLSNMDFHYSMIIFRIFILKFSIGIVMFGMGRKVEASLSSEMKIVRCLI